jgi:hypothetical protein
LIFDALRFPFLSLLPFRILNLLTKVNSDAGNGKEGSRNETRGDTLLAMISCCLGPNETLAGRSDLKSGSANRMEEGFYIPS